MTNLHPGSKIIFFFQNCEMGTFDNIYCIWGPGSYFKCLNVWSLVDVCTLMSALLIATFILVLAIFISCS